MFRQSIGRPQLARAARMLLVALGLGCFALTAAAQIKYKVPQKANPEAGLNPAITEQLILSEPQLTGFFAAYKELKEKGKLTITKGSANPADPIRFARGMKVSGDVQKILKPHTLKDATEFQRVGYNAALAYAVLKQGGKDVINEKLDAAHQQHQQLLAAFKQQMTPEQLKKVEQQLNASLGITPRLRDVPDSNVALVAKYEAQMAALGAH